MSTCQHRGHLGVTFGDLGVIFGHLGVTFGHFGITFGHLGVTFCRLGVTFGHLGVTFGHLGVTFGHLGVIFCHLGVTFCHLGVTFGPFGVTFGKTSKNLELNQKTSRDLEEPRKTSKNLETPHGVKSGQDRRNLRKSTFQNPIFKVSRLGGCKNEGFHDPKILSFFWGGLGAISHGSGPAECAERLNNDGRAGTETSAAVVRGEG